MVLQEAVPAPHSRGTWGKKREENPSSTREISHPLPTRSYQPLVPFPYRLAWTKLSQLQPRFARFLDTLCRIYVNGPFLNALKEALAHLRFLRKLLSKKGEPGEASVAPSADPAMRSYKGGHHLNCRILVVTLSRTALGICRLREPSVIWALA